MHIYPWQIDPTPNQSSIDALNIATPNLADLADIAQCTYMHGRPTPQSMEHRCLEYHYTKLDRYSRYSTIHIYTWQTYPLLQSMLDPRQITTPNKFHDRLTHPLLQSTIDPWQTTTSNKFHDRLTPPPLPIDHTSMADHYTP